MIRLLSLGLGVQSTTLAMMFENGDIIEDGEPVKLDGAIFADVGAEPEHVYRTLDWIRENVSFPVHVVKHKQGLLEELRKGVSDGSRVANPPFFTTSASGGGLLFRKCTKEYKAEPITQKVRELIGLKPRQRGPKEVAVIQYIGISLDEVIRCKPSRHSYIEHRWPLVDMGKRRLDCLTYMQERGYPKPGRSACTFCPYRNNKEWLEMKENDPESFEEAVEVDEMIRSGLQSTNEKIYVHRSMTPLVEVDFERERDQIDLFGEECEGLCGV